MYVLYHHTVTSLFFNEEKGLAAFFKRFIAFVFGIIATLYVIVIQMVCHCAASVLVTRT
jgi:hypothetical protein